MGIAPTDQFSQTFRIWCDGLSIMVERLPESQVEEIFAARDGSRDANLDLLTWAAMIRPRPAVFPN